MGKNFVRLCILVCGMCCIDITNAQAQAPNTRFPGFCPTWASMPVQGSAKVSDFHLLAAQDVLIATLEDVARPQIERCVGRSQMTNNSTVMVVIFADNFYGGRAALVGAQRSVVGGAWRFNTNNIANALTAERQAEEQKKQQAEAAQKKAQELADAKMLSQKLQTDFKSQTGLELWVNPQILKANPFPYKGKIVGMMESFQQMVGSGEAVFGGSFDVVATGVPNTLFTQPGSLAIIAIKVDGIKQIKILGTDMTAVDGTYKGSYICKTQGCAEFIGPH